ncbi:MAG: hypothetical protein SOT68_07615 [Oscillospiraceae bacterium]|nr:hypothetical protein [Oscillospiraceae bacterium]MDD7280208.1 hypothetical protein [Oscillospiraceae bacterium]MDY2864048.1 hypothetical protein [Oscillospiraceae bacterium]
MSKEILIKLRVITVVGLPFVLLLSAVMTGLFLCGVIKNESIPYLYFAVSMLVNTVGLIADFFVKNEDVREAMPNFTKGRGFAAFVISSGVIWFVSFLMFIILK